jgi:RTX calcium-binding nonapeptide repeat (4 copies)
MIPEILPQSVLDAVSSFLTNDLATDQGLGVISPTDKVNFTGHSLGDHVATLLAGMVETNHPNTTGTIYTYNAPGQGGIIPELANWAGIDTSISAGVLTGKITNVFGEGGVEVTAGMASMMGNTQPVFIESTHSANPITQIENHSIVKLSDSLALYELFGKIDPNVDPSHIKGLLLAASNQMDSSLEKCLRILTKLVQNQDPDLSTRELYYCALTDLRNSFGTAPLPGHTYLVVPLLSGSILSMASTAEENVPSGIAYRYALEQLNPFAIVTNTALYSAHNSSHELDLYNPDDGTGKMTKQYLIDRAAFLAEKVKVNVADNESLTNGATIGGNVSYYDNRLDYILASSDATKRYVGFGNDAANSLGGDIFGDHLYGGGGNDTIHGSNGDDYLQGDDGDDHLFGDNNDDLLLGMDGVDELDGGEGMDSLQGGRGNDILKGGDGAYFDLLYGGESDDTLTGGQGNDFLSGDEGNDTYKYTSGDGRDTIRDIGGEGVIQFDGQELHGAKKTFAKQNAAVSNK